MGDRGQVRVIQSEGDLWLYTHWGATDLIADVRRALARRQRWFDDEYLTRIIFCEMLRDSANDPLSEETGYGIGREQHGDVWRIVTVDATKQMVTVEDNFAGDVVGPVSFEAFVENGPLFLAEVVGGSSG